MRNTPTARIPYKLTVLLLTNESTVNVEKKDKYKNNEEEEDDKQEEINSYSTLKFLARVL
jgi:hypothetical protein